MEWGKLKTIGASIELVRELLDASAWWDSHKTIEYVNGTKELIAKKTFNNGNVKTKSVIFDEENRLCGIYNENKKDWV